MAACPPFSINRVAAGHLISICYNKNVKHFVYFYVAAGHSISICYNRDQKSPEIQGIFVDYENKK